MDLFFCDIEGTISSSKEERENELDIFVKNLSLLLNQSNSKKLIFGFISTGDSTTINSYITELKRYINDPRIEFGYNYGYDERFKYNEESEKITNGKNSQILHEIVENCDKTINNIYYADDTTIYHKILDHCCSKKAIPANKIVSFIPGIDKREISAENIIISCSKNKALKGLNQCIEEYIKQNNKTNETKKRYI